jgi:anaerobic magnesium-protoporphyrin IX monomethyl ester cyclase
LTKTLFLELEHDSQWALASVGPACIAGYLNTKGHLSELLRVPSGAEIPQLIDQISDQDPDIIGISLTSRQWLRAKQLVPIIKRELDLPIIAGGLHPTFASDLVLDTPGFDYVCIGEGEQAMFDFVEAVANGKSVCGIKNIRAPGEPMPKIRTPFEPLDGLPFMTRDMLEEKHGVVHVSTQRGCPYPCTYCAAPKIADLYQGGYAEYGRRRSPRNVIAELSEIQRNSELNYVVFLDDTFTINHIWVSEFCQLYREHFRIPFSINARAETVSRPLLRTLANAGCMHIIYGVESGSETVRRNILKRKISNAKIREVFQWTRDVGIMVTANYMLGIPGERKADIELTLKLHSQIQPDDFGYFVFYPYPGTPLFQECRAKGYLPEDFADLPANHRSSVLNLPELTKDDIEQYYDKFTELKIRDRLNYAPIDSSDSYRLKTARQIRDMAARG